MHARTLNHATAVALMVLVTLLWSIAGVVTRQLDAARSFEITFWRSAFNAAALLVLLAAWRGPGTLWRQLRTGGTPLWLCGLCWGVMFSAFMIALSLTTVANVLVTMALGPFFTALLARVALGHRVAVRTWAAIVVAGAGIAWMYAREVSGAGARHAAGVAVALAVPLFGAVNWIVMQHVNRGGKPPAVVGGAPAPGPRVDLLPAVLVGAAASALLALPLALPLQASNHDLRLLALLGVVQLAVPCVLAVWLTRFLSGPEIALLALLEVVFGVLWVWLDGHETPSPAVLGGGAIVLAALAGNELGGAMRRPAADGAAPS